MNKRILGVLSLAALLALAGCGNGNIATSSANGNSSAAGTSNATSTPASSNSDVAVTSVKITVPESTKVFDGGAVTLRVSVLPENATNSKVTWSTSDEAVATVVNGVVRFKTVSKETKVTITATSKSDTTMKDSIEFTVEHSLVNLATSYGNTLDTSMFLDDGTISAQPGDMALIYADVASTKWYVESTITIDSLNESDAYPKFGLMTSDKDDGLWNQAAANEHNAFFYLDTITANKSAGWAPFNFVASNADLNDWNWGGQLGGFNASPNIKMGTAYKVGLLRNGTDYYLYYGTSEASSLTCYKHVVWDAIPADTPSYAWVGGWNVGTTVGGFKALTGDAVDALYETPTAISLNKSSVDLTFSDASAETFQINVIPNKICSKSLAYSYASSDPAIASVSETGLVTAGKKEGKATISVTSGDLSASLEVNVMGSIDGVIFDGKMDEAAYTQDIKNNHFLLKKDDGNYVDYFAFKGEKGVHVFAKHHVATKKTTSSANWWENDNLEMRFIVAPDGNYQYWACTNPTVGSNFTKAYVGAATGDDTAGYDTSFELYVAYGEDGLPKTKADDIFFTTGFASNAGWIATQNYDANNLASAYYNSTIGTDGIHQRYLATSASDAVTAASSAAGSELISSPVTASLSTDGWKENCFQAFDGTKDFEVLYTFDNKGTATTGDFSLNWVADICSATYENGTWSEWANGGCTIRSDWWGWGAWNEGGKENPCGASDLGSWGDAAFYDATKDMSVQLDIKFSASTGRIAIFGAYTSNVASILGKTVYIIYATNAFDYRGDIRVKLGGNSADVTVNSIKLISGSSVNHDA